MFHQLPKRTLRNTILFVGAAAFILQCFEYINFAVDDVFISFRYAEQVYRGHGYVYNIGEYVEGYSNWLWVTLLALFARLGCHESAGWCSMLWSAKALSFGLGFVNVYLVHRLAKLVVPDHYVLARYTPFLLLCTSGAYALWTMGAMEIQLCTAFYLIAALQAMTMLQWNEERNRIPAWRFFVHGVSWLGACLTRPEPVLHAGISFLIVIIFLQRRERIRMLLWSVLPALALFAVFLSWRYATYHELVPNTYYAKSAFYFSRLYAPLKYILSAIGTLCGPFLFPAFIPLITRPRSRETLYLSLMCGATCFFILFISSSDWMPGYRFFIPVLGFLAVLAAMGMHDLFEALHTISFPRVSFIAALVLLVLGASARIASDRAGLRSAHSEMISGWKIIKGHSLTLHEQAADWLAHHEKQGPYLVAMGEAGFVGYENMNMILLDCNGLMDKQTARRRKNKEGFSVEYFLDRKPAYVFLYANFESDPLVETRNPDENYSYAFLHSARFHEEYSPAADFSTFHIYKRK